MKRSTFSALAALPIVTLAVVTWATVASAHAFLEHAVPSVGSTIQASPSELELTFTEGIVPAFSGVKVSDDHGSPVAVGKALVSSGEATTLHVRLDHGLKPGVYVVRWHVVAVDTHATSGSYRFTLAP